MEQTLPQERLTDYIHLKLNFVERLLVDHLSPADERIQKFLDNYLSDCPGRAQAKLPVQAFILDRRGLARLMSLPPDQDIFTSEIINSYRIQQGVLHNPKSDRRTTQGVFHIVEGGFPVPDDKIAVPKNVFCNLLAEAFRPPREMMRLPFTSTQEQHAEVFVSLLMRPVVSPAVEGVLTEKTMEIRFFAPGSLVSNLDFVESIFGNAGDPYLAQNDAALDIHHWTGHTGCVILAPHLISFKKKDLGLPSSEEATERQKRDGMCWKDPEELYNSGQAFKITCRDERGVIVTVIADNYFGYCKKEIKTQMSYAANLFGLCEEEHSGGAIAFPSYDLGEEFYLDPAFARSKNTFADTVRVLKEQIDVKPQGYAVDKKHPEILYVSETAKFNLPTLSVTWKKDGREKKIKLLANHTYVLPSGYKLRIKKQTGGHAWHLIGTVAEGVLCHKPCTVSGGGKSEISKSIVDAMIQGPVYTSDFQKDMDLVEEILKKDFQNRFKPEIAATRPQRISRPILSPERSLGSVIKLLTGSPEYTPEYNRWLETLPHHIKEILFAVKRFYRPEWSEKWREYFSVDIVNGHPGHELKFKNKKLVANYLRVGREKDGSWRIYRVRQDFAAAEKIQVADDITASITLPKEALQGISHEWSHASVKLINNCEQQLFQRPDDAIYRGYDKQAEADLASADSFLSNYQPLSLKETEELLEDAVNFDLYTEPMKKLLLDFLAGGHEGFVVSSAHPRVVDGKPSKNPRYLQKRPDLANPRKRYLAEAGTRLFRGIPSGKPVYFPVNAVLPGRRNNPPDRKSGVPALAVYSPIHYQELPELFMDFICSVTGKSPSTTGFGSEGALTKGPFNALWPIVDLHNALVSFILTGYQGFTSAAGYIGPNYRVDHDVSLLMPEIWCRMRPEEEDANYLIRNGFLAKVNDFQHKGKFVPASILGWRITRRFVNTFLGRIFNNPNIVFNDEMLAPEKQSLDVFVEGVENIVLTQKRVAGHYFADGSVEAAIPPLKALLHIMAHGHYEGKKLESPEVRGLFTREALLKSEWYQKRIRTKQARDIKLWRRHVDHLKDFLNQEGRAATAADAALEERLQKARHELERSTLPSYLEGLVGTIGADPFEKQIV